MRKTLLISYTLPPSPTGSATVIANLCRQFSIDELVVTGAKNRGIDTVFDWTNSPMIKYTSWKTLPFKGAGLVRLLMMPLTLLLTIYYYYKYKCKNIIAIYPNNDFFIMGWLAAVITGSNFYPYLHNTFANSKERTGVIKMIFEFIEKIIFYRATKILLISDGLEIFYSTKYKESFSYTVIKHTINEKTDVKFNDIGSKKNSKYLMVGSINESNRDAAIRLIKALRTIENSEILIRSGTHQMHLQSAGLYDMCTIIPELSRVQLFDLLNSVDALLLPHGFRGSMSSAEYLTIFPTKTIEYLLSGRPIIAHCPDNCFLYSFLTKNKCAFVISEVESDILIKKIIDFKKDIALQKNIVSNAVKIAKEFDAIMVSDTLKEIL